MLESVRAWQPRCWLFPRDMSIRAISCWFVMVCLSASAATLEQMSLEDLARKSTSVVRGRAGDSRGERIGPLIYTFTAFRVDETLKGEPVRQVEIAFPGGTIGDVSQRFGGVPRLEAGKDYLIFLWQGPSGRTQITGLTQGLFDIEQQPDGPVASRKPSSDVLIAPGVDVPVKNELLRLPLPEIMQRIRAILSTGGDSQP